VLGTVLRIRLTGAYFILAVIALLTIEDVGCIVIVYLTQGLSGHA